MIAFMSMCRRARSALLLISALAVMQATAPTRAADDPVGPPAVTPRDQARVMESPLVLTQPNSRVRLTGSLVFPGTAFIVAADNVTIDLQGHTVYYGSDDGADRHGVHLFVDFVDADKLTARVAATSQPERCEIVGGCIVHAGRGANCHAVYGYRGYNATIERMHLEAAGEDSACVSFGYGDCAIADSVLICRADRSADRHAGPANVRVAGGAVLAHDNILIGGNSGFNVGSRSKIERNLIAHNAHVTNGYGVWLYRQEDVVVTDNLIVPSNGRGILLNAGLRNLCRENVILAREKPNEEYGEQLNACGIRLRYEAADNVLERNTILAIGGPPWTGGSAMYVTNTSSGINRIVDNHFAALLIADPENADHYAKSLTFEVGDRTTLAEDDVRDNRLTGNHYLLSTSGPDGGCMQGPIIANSLDWSDGAKEWDQFLAAFDAKWQGFRLAAHPQAIAIRAELEAFGKQVAVAPLRSDRHTIYSGFYTWPELLTMLDSKPGEGVDLDDVLVDHRYDRPIRLLYGRSHVVPCVDAAGKPIARQRFTLYLDAQEGWSLASDAEGRLLLPLIDHGLQNSAAKPDVLTRFVPRRMRVTRPNEAPLEFDIASPPDQLRFAPSR